MATLPAVCTDTEQAGGGRVDLDLQSPRLLYSQKLRELLSITREGGMVCEISPSLFPCFTFLCLTYSHHIDILHFRHLATTLIKSNILSFPSRLWLWKKKHFFLIKFFGLQNIDINRWPWTKMTFYSTHFPSSHQRRSLESRRRSFLNCPSSQTKYVSNYGIFFFQCSPSFLRPIL